MKISSAMLCFKVRSDILRPGTASSLTTLWTNLRFLRTTSLLQWKGKTHEALVCAAPFHRSVLTDCVFWEETKTETAYDQKLRRDLEILRDETARQPLDPRWWYYLGQTCEGLKEYSKAIASFDRCIRLDGWSAESGWACYTAARCLVNLEAFREAEEYCALGMARTPGAP